MLTSLKFVRKIQFGFLVIAAISAAIAINDFIQIGQLESDKNAIFNEFIKPETEINKLYSEYQKTEFIMMKFAMVEFADNFQADVEQYNVYKENIDERLEVLEKSDFPEEIKVALTEVKDIWLNYKTTVADAIISASITQNYEFAAIIAASSGKEVGDLVRSKFDGIIKGLHEKGEILSDQIDNNVKNSRYFIAGGMLFGTIMMLLCVFYLAPAISKPIEYLKTIIRKFADGDFDVDIVVKTNDEIGELASMLQELKEKQSEKISAAQDIAEGKFSQLVPASDVDALTFAFNREVEIIENLLSESDSLLDANKRGDLTVRGNVDKFSGDWKRILEGFNSILDASLAPINEANEVLGKMAGGDFTAEMVGTYNGDYENIKNNVNQVVKSLNNVIGRVAQSASDIAASASEISASTEQMATGANEQNSQTTDVAGAVEEMIKTILENSRNATSAAEIAKQAGDKAVEGGHVVEKTIEGIARIADVVTKSSETMQKLGKSSSQIGEIIQVIEDIADQTNLLALNAAIEAARAGEQGRGFAVVADEVRKLAERTTKATTEIGVMIKMIQGDTDGAIKSIAEGTKEVEHGKELANTAGQALNEIINFSDETADLISQLATASEEQSTTGEQISMNVENISRVTEQSAEGTHQISLSAESLYRLTSEMEELTRQFKLQNVEIVPYNE
ncbi:MAG: HAMP domain-containing protein [Melioribacteraceae bacterium]|nr:HAMP domain-containing protein [Melioribacteraceae bacterium]